MIMCRVDSGRHEDRRSEDDRRAPGTCMTAADRSCDAPPLRDKQQSRFHAWETLGRRRATRMRR